MKLVSVHTDTGCWMRPGWGSQLKVNLGRSSQMAAVTVGERWLEMIKHIITQKNFSWTPKPCKPLPCLHPLSSSAPLSWTWCLKKQRKLDSFLLTILVERLKNKTILHFSTSVSPSMSFCFNHWTLLSLSLQTFIPQSSRLPLIPCILMIPALAPLLLSDASFWPVRSCTADEGPLARTHIAYIHHCCSTEKLQAHRNEPDFPSVTRPHADTGWSEFLPQKTCKIPEQIQGIQRVKFVDISFSCMNFAYCEYFKHFNVRFFFFLILCQTVIISGSESQKWWSFSIPPVFPLF